MAWARAALRVAGWSVAGAERAPKRCVMLGAPHTSKWDLPLWIVAASALDLPARFMVKHTLFAFPLGSLLRGLGALPIERDKRRGVVDASVEMFERERELVLLIAPEATRSRVTYWRSGFYHIAQRAGVAIVPLRTDYARRTVSVGPTLWPTGDVRADMDAIRRFYGSVTPRVPARFGEPRLREEDAQRSSESRRG